MDTHIKTDSLVKMFVRIRDARSALAAKFKEEDEKLKESLRIIETELLARAQAEGATGFRTDAGTTYIAEEVHASIASSDDFRAFVISTGNLDFYEQRVSLRMVKEFQARHDGAVPPGIRVFRENRMRVRASQTEG
jgi:hypothetical protein